MKSPRIRPKLLIGSMLVVLTSLLVMLGYFLTFPSSPLANGKAPTLAFAPTTLAAGARQPEMPPEVRQLMEAKRYEIRATQPTAAPDDYQAFSPAHGMRASFSGKGFDVTPITPSAKTWRWGMSLREYGYGVCLERVGNATLVAIGNRIEYQRGNLIEWYVNRADGLEQGFTIMGRPAIQFDREPLRLRLELSGSLRARVNDEGDAIALLDATGQQVLAYDHLVVNDRAGRELPSHFEVAEGAVNIVVADAGAVYPVTIDPTLTQQAYLKVSNTRPGHRPSVAGQVWVTVVNDDCNLVWSGPHEPGTQAAAAAPTPTTQGTPQDEPTPYEHHYPESWQSPPDEMWCVQQVLLAANLSLDKAVGRSHRHQIRHRGQNRITFTSPACCWARAMMRREMYAHSVQRSQRRTGDGRKSIRVSLERYEDAIEKRSETRKAEIKEERRKLFPIRLVKLCTMRTAIGVRWRGLPRYSHPPLFGKHVESGSIPKPDIHRFR